MRTVTTPPATRRRVSRGAARDNRPRLWGDEPTAAVAAPAPAPALTPATATAAAIAEPVATLAPPTATAIAIAEPPAATARTLEDLLLGAWDGLAAGGAIECPVCASAMTPRWSAGAGVVGGRCGGCGTTLE